RSLPGESSHLLPQLLLQDVQHVRLMLTDSAGNTGLDYSTPRFRWFGTEGGHQPLRRSCPELRCKTTCDGTCNAIESQQSCGLLVNPFPYGPGVSGFFMTLEDFQGRNDLGGGAGVPELPLQKGDQGRRGEGVQLDTVALPLVAAFPFALEMP